MKKPIPTRWYARWGSVSNRRALDIHGHPIFINASIGRRRRVVVEAWEVRLGEQEIGIVWSVWGRHFLRWHYAEATMHVERKWWWEREHAIDALVAKVRQRRMEAARPSIRPAPELDDFPL